jgi:hypothetical protein
MLRPQVPWQLDLWPSYWHGLCDPFPALAEIHSSGGQPQRIRGFGAAASGLRIFRDHNRLPVLVLRRQRRALHGVGIYSGGTCL